MKRVLFIVCPVFVLSVLVYEWGDMETPYSQFTYTPSDIAIAQAYQQRQSNVPIQSSGRVTQILPDDHKGDRHQRFIVTLDSGLTLLIAHNIDLAPRIDKLGINDEIEFKGVYEWNSKGGVVHWTHQDPAGRLDGGWIKHSGKTFQ